MVMGRNGHGPKWLWAEMTRNRRRQIALLMYIVKKNAQSCCMVHVTTPFFTTLFSHKQKAGVSHDLAQIGDLICLQSDLLSLNP